MLFRAQARNPKLLMQVGMAALALGALTLHYGARMGLSVDVADGLGGLFYGLSIGSLLMSVIARRRRSGNGGAGSA